jgi:peptide/nickel transport system substrate-binding protein
MKTAAKMTWIRTVGALHEGISRRSLVGAAGAVALGGMARPVLAQTPRRGGLLAAALWPEPPSLVAALTSQDQTTMLSAKVLEGLVTYGYDMMPRPRLATAWEAAPDGRSLHLALRRGVTWHDGREFTSADVAFTILRILKRYHPLGRVIFAQVTDVETPDPHTAILRMAQPSPMILASLAGFISPMVPRHVYEAGDPLRNPANSAPIGTGPFRFREWRRGSAIVLDRNESYWDEGKPYLDRLVYRVLSDGAARSAALDAGEVVLAGPNPVPYSELDRFRANPEFTVELRGEELLLHVQALQINLRHPELAKPEVRRAVYHAIDRDALVRAVWYGAGRPSSSPVPYQAHDMHAPDLPAYPYDPDRARTLLDSAGLTPDAGGVRLRLRIDWVPLGQENLLTAQFIRQSLRRVGLDIAIRSVDLPSYIRLIYNDYDFDLNIMNYFPTHDPSVGVQRFYWSKAASKGTPFVNASGFADAQVDQLLEQAAIENDPAKRRDLIYRFQQRTMVALPILPLVDLDYVSIVSRRLHDVMLRPEGIRDNFADVWIDP